MDMLKESPNATVRSNKACFTQLLSPTRGADRKPTFVDIFAGCGGLSFGLLNAGWRGLFAVERDIFAFETLRTNLIDGHNCPQFDWPRSLAKREMPISSFIHKLKVDKVLKSHLQDIDLLAGGPPCQGFSFAGQRDHGDPRNNLFRSYLKVVKLLRPRFLLIENVKGITVVHKKNSKGTNKKKIRMTFAGKIHRALKKIDYETFDEIHKASEFGVPQERPRYVVIGIDRKKMVGFTKDQIRRDFDRHLQALRPEFFREKGLSEFRSVTVKDALSDLETYAKDKEPCPDAPRREQLKYTESKSLTAYQALLRRSAPENMNSMRLAKHSAEVTRKFCVLIKECKLRNRRGVTLSESERSVLGTKKRTVVVLDPDKPSHTITTLPDDLLHYEEPRILTVREYARLQSFPDWFCFTGKYTTGGEMRTKECPRYTQIGNAVAPFVAEALGQALAKVIRSLKEVESKCVR
jgi:DNA (cytosine-5)-methyltransferase 1